MKCWKTKYDLLNIFERFKQWRCQVFYSLFKGLQLLQLANFCTYLSTSLSISTISLIREHVWNKPHISIPNDQQFLIIWVLAQGYNGYVTELIEGPHETKFHSKIFINISQGLKIFINIASQNSTSYILTKILFSSTSTNLVSLSP